MIKIRQSSPLDSVDVKTINQIIENCGAMQQHYAQLVSKFMKSNNSDNLGEIYSGQEIEEVKQMISKY